MGLARRSIVVLSMLCTAAFATESSDLLDAFNETSLELPSIAFEIWDGGGDIESSEFKDHYVDQFTRYIDLASQLSIRAIACADGDIPQADDYQSMTNLRDLYIKISESLSSAETKIKLWVDLNDQNAMNELGRLIPSLTVSYSRMLFELSSCSGYLYGELVN